MNLVSRGQRTAMRGCDRKFRYRDKDGADYEVARLKADGAHDPERLHSYSCPHCDGFHIGHVRVGKKVY